MKMPAAKLQSRTRTLVTGTVSVLAALAVLAPAQFGASYYPISLDDPQAVYLTRDQFPIQPVWGLNHRPQRHRLHS